jgi:hypothetical protein
VAEEEGSVIDKGLYAILRFAKYKGPEISNIEAHNERRKEKYASNPDIDPSRSKYNFHIVEPTDRYRRVSEALIKQYDCPRVRSDSVRIVETLITASPEFFEGKSKQEIYAFFRHAVEFLRNELGEDRLISAVIHMDEKTPHMHVSFVPITKDGRLSAKEIIGNRKSLVAWQDRYWQHMVSKYPELERGESASKTGREHIPPRVFKQAANLNKQAKAILELLSDTNALNARRNAAELDRLLRKFFPERGKFLTKTKQYDQAIRSLKAENADLKQNLKEADSGEMQRRMAEARLKSDYIELERTLQKIPPEIVFRYSGKTIEQERGD